MHEVWFNIGTGEIAVGQDAAEALIAETGDMIVPLEELVLDDNFPFQPGDYPRIKTADITQEEALIAGKSLARIFQSREKPLPMGKKHIERLNILGLLPGINYIKRNFGRLSTYVDEIGAVANRKSTRFDGLTTPEIMQLVLDVHLASSPDSPVTMKEIKSYYDADILPHYDYIIARTGNLAKINEYLGFPDIASWDQTDYILYGARVIRFNGEGGLTARNLDNLAIQDRKRVG